VILLLTIQSAFGAFEGMHGTTPNFLFDGSDSSLWADHSVKLVRIARYGIPELAITGLEVSYPYKAFLLDASWQTSGDNIYRENKFSGGVGYTCPLPYKVNLSCLATADVYRLEIKRFGNSTGSAISGRIDLSTPHHLQLSLTGDGLLAGGLPDGTIDRILTGNAYWSLDSMMLFGGSTVYYTNDGHTSFQLSAENRFNQWFTCRLAVTDTPRRVGFATALTVRRVSFTLVADYTDPLGWSQRAMIRYRW